MRKRVEERDGYGWDTVVEFRYSLNLALPNNKGT